ncbi:MAG TPA: hypothetical protein VMH06_02510 [Thermodesulfovibrionales bacterium]|nr:hypothetical protein [Thermodesulfovibrionales bacterium]
MKRKLLFVTYHDENFEEGLSYALDLAKTMNDGIALLMVYRRTVLERFEDMMTVVTFAEANEHKTARELIRDDLSGKSGVDDYDRKIALLTERCEQYGIPVEVNAAATDVLTAVRNILKQKRDIDMVLLSPSVTGDGSITTKTLNKLVKTASRPVVTMARNGKVA